MSLGPIVQSIEILSKEKGIDPKIILDAVKDAMLVAARKHFHTTEELAAELDESTGAILIYGVKRVVAEVADPEKEISLDDARALRPDAEIDSEIRFPKRTEALAGSRRGRPTGDFEKVREAEHDNVFSNTPGASGNWCAVKLNGLRRIDRQYGKTELNCRRTVKLESFSVGGRMACVIKRGQNKQNAG
jgi:N utilization substance protein A